MRLSFTLPLKTVGLNGRTREHWSVGIRRRKKEHRVTHLEMRRAKHRAALSDLRDVALDSGVTVELCRLSAGVLDYDNLVASQKHVRDQVAEELGFRDDSDPRLRWVYTQARVKRGNWGVRVTITPVAAEEAA